MKIHNLRTENSTDKARVAATVTWEDCDQPTTDVYFETDAAFADSLTCNPHAFLVGCLIQAFYHGEERVFIDEEICPELHEGLTTAMHWIHYWFNDSFREIVRIEAITRAKSLTPGKPERAGFFFSGGIDSWAALRANRLKFPSEHPGSFKDGLVVYGMHLEEPPDFKQVLDSLSKVTIEARINLLPVRTNIVSLGHGWDFWTTGLFAAAFSAVAHAVSHRLSVVSLASAGWSIPHLVPHASHPLIDSNYSSSDLRIRHDGVTLSRLDKVRLLAGWDLALQHLRVCNNTNAIRPDRLNCGRCEKCVRTMLEFLAVGALDRVSAFQANDVSPELVLSAVRLDPIDAPFYQELLGPLSERGRNDLVAAIKSKLSHYQRVEKVRRLKERVKQMDRKYFQGRLVGLKRSLSGNTQAKVR